MLRIGITGQGGFIGTHLFNYPGLQIDLKRISFENIFFQNEQDLEIL